MALKLFNPLKFVSISSSNLWNFYSAKGDLIFQFSLDNKLVWEILAVEAFRNLHTLSEWHLLVDKLAASVLSVGTCECVCSRHSQYNQALLSYEISADSSVYILKMKFRKKNSSSSNQSPNHIEQITAGGVKNSQLWATKIEATSFISRKLRKILVTQRLLHKVLRHHPVDATLSLVACGIQIQMEWFTAVFSRLQLEMLHQAENWPWDHHLCATFLLFFALRFAFHYCWNEGEAMLAKWKTFCDWIIPKPGQQRTADHRTANLHLSGSESLHLLLPHSFHLCRKHFQRWNAIFVFGQLQMARHNLVRSIPRMKYHSMQWKRFRCLHEYEVDSHFERFLSRTGRRRRHCCRWHVVRSLFRPMVWHGVRLGISNLCSRELPRKRDGKRRAPRDLKGFSILED